MPRRHLPGPGGGLDQGRELPAGREGLGGRPRHNEDGPRRLQVPGRGSVPAGGGPGIRWQHTRVRRATQQYPSSSWEGEEEPGTEDGRYKGQSCRTGTMRDGGTFKKLVFDPQKNHNLLLQIC